MSDPSAGRGGWSGWGTVRPQLTCPGSVPGFSSTDPSAGPTPASLVDPSWR